jgi:hypothetical protein
MQDNNTAKLCNGGEMEEDDQSTPLETNESVPKTGKNVKFKLNEEDLAKFTDGEEIIDQKNPFKKDENGFRKVKANKKLKFGRKTANSKMNGTSKAVVPADDEFITKEDVLKESKYVKTYIKNPDKVLTYDKSVLEKLKFVKQKNKVPVRKAVALPKVPPVKTDNVRLQRGHNQRPEIQQPLQIGRIRFAGRHRGYC